MNILFVLKTYTTGGLEVVTATLANYFSSRGNNVSIVAFAKDNGSILNRIDKSVHTYTLNGIACNSQNVKLLREIFQKEQVQVVINQWGLPFYPLKTAIRASMGLNVKFISVYHNTPDMNGRIQSVDNELAGTKNHFSRWCLKAKRLVFKTVTSYSMRWNYNHSDAYILLSHSFIPIFKKFTGISNAGHVYIQTNPVTIDHTGFEYDLNKKQKEIIFVGRLDNYQKKVNRIIDTWGLLEKKFPDWRLTIVGDGEERNNLEDKVNQMQLKRVSFEGFQSPKPYYERASILMLTSEFEGFPLVLAEAMSFGVIPVVYGSYAAVYDIIKDNQNGFIIQPEKGLFNKESAAKKLSQLMSDTNLRECMAKDAVETSKRYSLDCIYDSWMAMFNQLNIEK